jgi:hypothetical protein
MRKNRLVAIAAAMLIALSPAAVTAQEKADDDRSETYRQLKLFGDVFERVRSDYVEDSDEFAVHVNEHGLYTPASRQRIAAYYRGDYKGKSIVSFTIRGPVSAATDESPVTLGAVNVYRNYAGIMGGLERARQFAHVTAPFRHLPGRACVSRRP